MMSDSVLLLKGDSSIVQLVHYSFARNGPNKRGSSRNKGPKRPGRERLPDMMILDMVLEGVNGLEIYWKLRRDYSVESLNILGLTVNDRGDSNSHLDSADLQKLFGRELKPADLN